MRFLTTLVALVCLCPSIISQRLYTIDKSYQGQISYDVPENATQLGDQKIARFALNYVEPLTLRFTKEGFQSSSNTDDSTISYQRLRLAGSGTFWQSVTGVQGVWIDLRSQVLATSSYTPTDFANAGVSYINGQSITYNITYINTLTDSYDIIHAHGQTASDWRTDGAAFLSAMPLAPFQSATYSYTIPWSNAGTYFLHSHWGFNALHGVQAPLVIVTDAPANYLLKPQLDSPNLVDVMMFLEDWCVQMTDADDSLNNPNFDPTAHREPYICQNPFLSYRAMWGEWNTDPEKKAQQSPALDARAYRMQQFRCENPVEAFEFNFAYFLANGREYIDSETRKLNPGDQVRLRIINAGALTTYRIILPAALNAQVIAVDGHYVNPVPSSTTNNVVWIAVGQRMDLYFTVPTGINTTYSILAVQETPSAAQAAGDNDANATDVGKLSVGGYSGIAVYTSDIINLDITPTVPTTPGLLAKNKQIIVNQETSFLAYGTDLGWGAGTSKANRWIQVDLNGYNGIRGINGLGWQLPPTIPLSEFVPDPHPFKIHSGDKVCLNITNWDHEVHPIHLHGHTFQIKEIDGIPIEGAMRDTIQVPVCSHVIACFNANAAPDSVHALHCHMMLHEMSGMQVTIQYENYVPIPNTYTGAMDAYIKSLSQSNNNGGNSGNTNAPINNYYNYASSTSDITRTGLGVGLALGLALLISWIFFGCAFYRYSQSHHYRPNAARPSVSMAHPGKHATSASNGNLQFHQDLDEPSQSQQP